MMNLCLLGLIVAGLLALAGKKLNHAEQEHLLDLLAVLFPLSEIGKQLLLTAWHGSYLLWYFPFQLCSLPLYLLPLRQLLVRSSSPRAAQAVSMLTDFLADFGLLGGLFAFADQSGMQYALPILTLHSYLWHAAMVGMALLLILSSRHSAKKESYPTVAGLFLLFAALAEGINLLFHARGSINMFYISLWEPVTQIVFRDIAARIGKLPEILLYLTSLLLGGGVIHLSISRLYHQKSQ